MTIILLAIAGLTLIFLEFFMPGAILAVLGCVSLLASVVVCSMRFSIWWGMLYLLLLAILSVVTCKFAMWQMKRSHSNDDFYLGKDQEGYSASGFARDVVGKTGIVTTELKPSGHIVIDGKQYQALSQTGFAHKGDTVIVVGGQGSHLLVRKMTNHGENQ